MNFNNPGLKKSILLWVLATVLTLVSAIYQRMTGPTYPIREKIEFHGRTLKYQLHRSHGGEGNHWVKISVPDPGVIGVLEWKRYKTEDRWTSVNMGIVDEALQAPLPHQPPAGKLEYRVRLFENNEAVLLPKAGSTVIRFKGEVPPWILVPHIISMFLAMIFSFRTGLEVFVGSPERLKRLTYWTLGLLFAGGLICGPIVQKYAFGAFWTGFPFGTDLTDNKTLIAFVGWLIALAALHKAKNPKPWVVFATIIMTAIYLIPHSLMGSELDYKKLDAEKASAVQK